MKRIPDSLTPAQARRHLRILTESGMKVNAELVKQLTERANINGPFALKSG